jgi:hypothetical protein
VNKDEMKIIGVFLLITIAVIPLSTAVSLNVPILYVARNKVKEEQTNALERSTLVRMWRTVLTATIMVGTMVISAAPFCFIIIAVIAEKAPYPQALLGNFRLISLGTMSVSAHYFASPFIYARRIPQVRKFYAGVIRGLQCKPTSTRVAFA